MGDQDAKTCGLNDADVERNMEVEDGTSKDVPVEQVMESVGVSDGDATPEGSKERSNETLSVQKRLKSQKRAHEREVRELHQRIGDLEARMSQPQQSSYEQQDGPYNAGSSNIDDHIQKAVGYALRAREDEERKARDAQNAAHIHRKYQDFQKHLDTISDKYDDFHDVVMAPDAKYTSTMRDYAARTMAKHGPGSAGEVLYKLGKNPEELKRISELHPDDQAEELHKLSIALSRGVSEEKHPEHKPLGHIKSNPVSHSNAVVTDKTPIGDIRQRMKQGAFK